MTSRLLFAAARGARIQSNDLDGGWSIMYSLPTFEHSWFRVHPDDEHLAYGPVSTALREMGEKETQYVPVVRTNLICCGLHLEDILGYAGPYGAPTDELHRSLFLLILAEALADEGL